LNPASARRSSARDFTLVPGLEYLNRGPRGRHGRVRILIRLCGWRGTRLNCCGARIGGAKSGFNIAGGPARAGDIAFVALLSAENDLFVEIDDDRFSGNGADKLLDEL